MKRIAFALIFCFVLSSAASSYVLADDSAVSYFDETVAYPKDCTFGFTYIPTMGFLDEYHGIFPNFFNALHVKDVAPVRWDIKDLNFKFKKISGYDYSNYVLSFHFVVDVKYPDGTVSQKEIYEMYDLSQASSGFFSGMFSRLVEEDDSFSCRVHYGLLLNKLELPSGTVAAVSHVGVRLADLHVFKYGLTVEYDFTYRNNDLDASVCTQIDYGLLNSFTGDYLEHHSLSDEQGVPAMNEFYTYLVEEANPFFESVTDGLNDFFTLFLKNFPSLLKQSLFGLIHIINALPSYFIKLLPFIPRYVIIGACYIGYFSLLLSVFRIFKRG